MKKQFNLPTLTGILLFALLLSFQAKATVYYVKSGGSGNGNGLSWMNASGNLAAVISASVAGDEIWVAAGTYRPSNDPSGNSSPADPQDKTFAIPEGVKLYGGFAGTETLLSQRNIAANITLLDGDIGILNNTSDNCYHVVLCVFSGSGSASVTIDGFIIKNGTGNNTSNLTVGGYALSRAFGAGIVIANGAAANAVIIENTTVSDNTCNRNGGGIYIESSGTVLLNNNKISTCSSSFEGGGMFVSGSTVTMTGNIIVNNKINSGGSGGGVYINNAGSVSMNQNTFSFNFARTQGGAISISNSGPVMVNNDIFSNNSGVYGGAIALKDCSPSGITASNFTANIGYESGGAIYAEQTTLNVSNCTISANTSLMRGAGISFETNSGTVNNCSISNNTGPVKGGGIYCASCTVSNSTITGNSGTAGGGIYCSDASTIDHNTINSNVATGSAANTGAGGIYLAGNGNSIHNNTIKGNSSSGAPGGGVTVGGTNNMLKHNSILNNTGTGMGGGIYIPGGSNTVANNSINGNSSYRGGGIAITGGTNTISSNTIAVNNATSTGGGIAIDAGTHTLSNNILWLNTITGNSNSPGADFSSSIFSANICTFRNNLLQFTSSNYTTTGTGLYDLGTASGGNIFNTDPQFNDISNITGPDGIDRTPDDGLMLLGNSPSLNSGDNSLISSGITTDITGGSRILGTTVDMGAYEFRFFCDSWFTRLYVNAAASTPATNYSIGRSWAYAYPSLSKALEAARQCNVITEIWVAAGTYKPELAFPGISNPTNARDKTFYVSQDIKLYGGFNGTETLLSQRNIPANETILSGDIGITGNATDNCYHVASAASNNILIDGFTIRDGNANGPGTYLINGYSILKSSGGGLVFGVGSNTLTNSIITANTADNEGGGLYLLNSSNTISNNFIIANTSRFNGGGIRSQSADNLIINNLFANNSSSGGGGIFIVNGNNILSNNTLSENSSVNNGGGVFTIDGNNQFNNNIFWNNKKNGNANVQAADYFRNSFNNNNNVFKNNLLQLSSGNYSTSGSGNFDLSNTASGNIFATNPKFLNAAAPSGTDGLYRTADDGMRPDACSPAINAGNNSQVPPWVTTDIANTARILLGTVDIGAYEAASNTANQSAAIATSNLVITKTQSTATVYTNDCSTLIALVTSSGSSPISGSTTARVWIEPTPPSGFVKRHYEITPAANAPTATGRITLYFTQQDFTDFNATNAIKLPIDATDAANNKANLRIEKRAGTSNNGSGLPPSYTGSITNLDPADADITWNSAGNRWEVSFDITGFSGFFVKTSGSVLPLQWISVSAALNSFKQAIVNWTVEEQNVIRYDVEKSNDGTRFVNIGSISGQGDGVHTYTFTETIPLQASAFFRIRQTDADGKISYSRITTLFYNSPLTLTVFPNPVQTVVTITSNRHQKAEIVGAAGNIIKTLVLPVGSITLNTEGWARGLYLLKTETGEKIKLIRN